MVTCKKCSAQMDELDAYCPNCGAVSASVKQNSKGKIFIPLDKVIPYGLLSIACSFVINIIGFIIFHRILSILFGLGLALSVLGVVLIATFKKSVLFARSYTATLRCDDEGERCGYCNKTLKQNNKYCSLCGSKVRR